MVEDLKLDQFASLYAFGTPIPKALRDAGYEINTIAFGYSLLKGARCQELVQQHRDWIKEKLSSSVEHLIQQIDRDREFAYQCEQPGAAVSATMNKAKLMGITDPNLPKKVIITWDDDGEE